MNALGADYSVWQDDNTTAQPVNFAKARSAGLAFAGIKASQGVFADPDFIINWANARNQVYRMPYHFLVWDQPPADQARFFWGLLRNDPGELPLICDFEWWKTVPLTAIGMIRVFLETLKGLTGRPLGIYTAKSFWDQYGSKDPYWKQYALWLCDISGPVEVPLPWTSWDFHQYTFKLFGPSFGAESLDLDGDRYCGTVELMQQRYVLPELPAIAEPEIQPGLCMRVLTNGLNIRSAPSTGAVSVGSLQAGEVLEVQDVGGTNAWVRHARGWSCVQLNATRHMEVA